MANRTLSDLPVETTVAGTDILHTRKSLTDKSITQTKIAEYVQNNSDYSPTVVSVTGTSHVISTTIRKQILLVNISSNCTLSFPGTFGDGKEIVIYNDAASTANVIGLPNSEVLFPGQEITFVWDGSAFIKREFNTRFFEGTASPTITPNYAGQVFVDATNNRIWVSTGSSTSADWTEISDTQPNVNAITADYPITTTDGYNNIDFTHSSTTALIEADLPSVSANNGRIIRLSNVGTDNGLSYVNGDSTNILFNAEVKAVVKLYMRGDYVLLRSNGTYWIVEDYNINIEIGLQNRTDETNVKIGNSVTYDTKSAAVDWTGKKFSGADGSGTNTCVCLYDSGGSGTSGELSFYNISGSLGYFVDSNTLTASDGSGTALVNEVSGDSRDVDKDLYHGFGLYTKDINTKVDFSLTGLYTDAINLSWVRYENSGADRGIQNVSVDTNKFFIKMGQDGMMYFNNTTGVSTNVSSTSIYINIKLKF